jgi:exopolyphosphatase/guanosine-5'-triphosphate,3'-diphosphate pyrophosphatase
LLKDFNKRREQMPFSKPVAVIDIGSNSVRLVIYDGLKRAPTPLFNEKVLCGLAKGIDKTGMLNKEGVIQAEIAIRRFVKLTQIMQVSKLNIFATAAVRDATDGENFVKNLQSKYNVKITVFSGKEEAEHAGLGIVSSISKAKGVVGDLGGGSLELIGVGKGQTFKGTSFPIGPLRTPESAKSKEQLKQFVDSYIDQFPLQDNLSDKDFYAVGGAFRSLAKVHMARKNYPLKVIHNYKVTTEDFLTTIQIVSRMSEESLMKIPGISAKRSDFLPYAALVLEQIIKKGNPQNIVFAASGVREGVLFSQLTQHKKSEDGLISGCIEMMGRIMRNPEYGYELAEWMSPLFAEESNQSKRLRIAACIMSEISCFENTEYRAELAYRKVLDSSLIALSHKDRVFIAKSLYCRYSTYPDEYILSTMQSLLSTKKIQLAQIIGSAMRLGRSLSCSNIGILQKTCLKISGDKLILDMNGNQDLEGEAIQKRLRQLAEVIGLEPKLV